MYVCLTERQEPEGTDMTVVQALARQLDAEFRHCEDKVDRMEELEGMVAELQRTLDVHRKVREVRCQG